MVFEKINFQRTSRDLVHRETNGSVLSGCWAMVVLALVGVLVVNSSARLELLPSWHCSNSYCFEVNSGRQV